MNRYPDPVRTEDRPELPLSERIVFAVDRWFERYSSAAPLVALEHAFDVQGSLLACAIRDLCDQGVIELVPNTPWIGADLQRPVEASA